jgi:pre-rRNA-processing protein TSR4
MPNLINVLKENKDRDKRQTEVERKKAIAQALKSGEGMSWGTVMIFSCKTDCCTTVDGQGKTTKECWREEYVLVQWDT